MIVGGMYDPATMLPGVYTYTIAAAAPCLSASAAVTVTLEVAPDAGTSALVDVCPASASFNLIDILGGTPQLTGAWTGPGGLPFSGTFDPGSDVGGVHTYTIPGTVCVTSTSTVTVNVLPGPDAGGDNSIVVCNDQGAFNLLTQLTGTPDATGTWTNANGTSVGAVFNPLTTGSVVLTYTVPGAANCPDDLAVLSITVNVAPVAGISGSLTLCEGSLPVSLFDGLTGTLDAGGVWTGPGGIVHATILDPAFDVSGVYTYTVTGTAPCADAFSTVNVTINPVPYAGEDGSAIFCTTAPSVALISLLGGTPQSGGTWADPEGAPFAGTLAPGIADEGDYTYTIAGIAPCVSDQSIVAITLSTAANAGSGGAITLCHDDAPIDLFAQLGSNPDANGIWTGPGGVPATATFDPAIDPSGPYVYVVVPDPPCPAIFAVLDMTVVQPAVAEILTEQDGSCAPAEVLLSHAYVGPGACTWILGNGEVVNDCAPVTAVYSTPGSYDVTLIVDAGNGCGADTVTVEDFISVYARPLADFEMVPPALNTLDPVAFFNNTSIGSTGWYWLINDALITEEEDMRYVFPAQIGDDYGICLVAYASGLCMDTLCKVITIEEGMRLNVPNSFTPNGDNINESFVPIVNGVDPDFYRFEVYDRWGLLVFSSETIGEAWSGLQPDGTEAPLDVYVWKVKAKDAYSGDRVERIGHVSLLR